MSKKRLGKGLSALLPVQGESGQLVEGVEEFLLNDIKANPNQPRRDFSIEKLEELSASIKEHGVLQPIILCRSDDGKYSLVAGERRFRAAKMAGLNKIPAVVKDLTPTEVMEIALIENLQREDLNPVEEAQAYRQLLEDFNFTQEQLATRLGKSRPAISNMLRLLQLPKAVLKRLAEGHLTMGHARSLLSLKNEEKINEVASQIMDKDLSVRASEDLVNYILNRTKEKVADKNIKHNENEGKDNNPFMEDLEEQLRIYLGCQIKLRESSPGKGGKLEILFYNGDDLERIVELILQDEKKL